MSRIRRGLPALKMHRTDIVVKHLLRISRVLKPTGFINFGLSSEFERGTDYEYQVQ